MTKPGELRAVVNKRRDPGRLQKFIRLDLALGLVGKIRVHQVFDEIHDDVVEHQRADHFAHIQLGL